MSAAADSPETSQLKIEDIFERCSDKKTVKKQADFVSTVKALWTSLDNFLTLVDLAGVWAITVSSIDDDRLDFGAFSDFFNGISKLKYPSTNGDEFCQLLINDMSFAEKNTCPLNFSDFERKCDRSIIHELFRVDAALKKAFASFAVDSITDGTFMSEEVKRRSLGIEVCDIVFVMTTCIERFNGFCQLHLDGKFWPLHRGIFDMPSTPFG